MALFYRPKMVKRRVLVCDIQWWWEAKNRNIYGNQILDEIIDSSIIYIYIQKLLYY